MRIVHFLAATSLVCLLPAAAFGQACTKPLTLKNEVQMTSFGGGPSSVPAKINGAEQKLTLSTATQATQISADLAKKLNLEVKRGDTVLTDDAGNEFRDQATLDDFTVGTLHGTKLAMPITPAGGRGGGGGGGFGSDGKFSLNLLMRYDLDADFGTDKLRLFDQDHCPGGVLYWKAEGAVGVLPLTVVDGKVTVPVILDGKAITAVIDTAARDTSMYNVVAERVLGIEPGGPKAPADSPSRAFDGQSYSYTPTSLTLNALALSDVKIMLKPEPANKGGGGAIEARNRMRGIQMALQNPTVTLGMDVLRKLHIYMAFGEKRLYATNTVAALPAAGPPKAP